MTQELRLFNTLSAQVEALAPLAPPEVTFYTCGPTVYNRAHVGNFRSFVATDVLRRTLTHLGYRVREVMNVTDVDDRIIQKAQEAGKDLGTFTAEYIEAFEEDMATLRLERPEHMPRATEHIPEMIALIERLQARGHTYTAEGSVYFRIASFPRVRAARPARRGRHPGRGAGGHRQVRQGERAGLRALEVQERRAGVGAVGGAVRKGPARAGTSSARR